MSVRRIKRFVHTHREAIVIAATLALLLQTTSLWGLD